MMTGNNEQTIKALTEVGCLLKYFPSSYIDKLPNKLLKLINEKTDKKYIINVDPSKKINEQKICKETTTMLAILTYNYWSSEEQKQTIRSNLYANQKNLDEYAIENIFKTNSYIEKANSKKEEVQLVENKENFIIRFIKAIKNKFKKKV